MNMEGINTMFLVHWEDGSQETLRLIEDYLNSEVWLEEEQSQVTQFMASVLLGKLSKIRDKKEKVSETVKDKEERSEDTKYTP